MTLEVIFLVKILIVLAVPSLVMLTLPLLGLLFLVLGSHYITVSFRVLYTILGESLYVHIN